MSAAVTLLLLLPTVVGSEPATLTAEPDELLLQKLGVDPTAEALLTFARLRVTPPTPAEIRSALESVRTGAASDRAVACVRLLAAGPLALPHVQRAARESEHDPAAKPLRVLSEALESHGGATTTAVIRLLAKKAPEQAPAALLALIPTAEDEVILGELRLGLTQLARVNPAAGSVLRKALDDPLALRRAVVIEATAAARPGEAASSLKPYLNDRVPLVQLRAALALASFQEEAVARLISLVGELPIPLSNEAEEFLLGLAQDQAPRLVLGDSLESRGLARDAWQKWWDATTGEALLGELRKRTLLEEDRATAEKLIQKLGAEEFEVREQASADLKALGPRMRSLLRVATRSADAEIAQRASTLLAGMARDNVVPLPTAVPRLLALRRPAGSAEALLAFLPFNEEAGTVEDIVSALARIARLMPASRKVILAALDDPVPLRRQVAVEALGRVPDLDSLEPLRRCLDDREVSVRLRAALALVRQGDRAAIPAALGLIGQVSSPEEERLLDDFLFRLAEGLGRPATTEGTSDEARRARQVEWQKWWQTNETRVALPRFDEENAQSVPRTSGLTLVLFNATGTIIAYDAELRERWQIRGLNTPFDAQMLPGERVLVAEHDLCRVTERNLQGEVLWEKKVSGNPIQVERLPSGNTFIVCRNQLLEVTRTGREVFTIARPAGDLYTARKLRDGSIACLSNQGRCFRMDARGHEISGFRITNGLAHLGNDLLPGGGALIPISWQNKITEYDREGKVVKQHTFTTPVSAQRLRTGGMLLVNQQWPPRLVELDRSGQIVRETNLATNALRAIRR